MKKRPCVFLCVLLSIFSQAQTKSFDSFVLHKKIDSLSNVISHNQNISKRKDTLVVTVEQLAETFKQNKTPWFDKLLPSFIALITVLISSFFAYKIGIKNVLTQEQNAEKQIRAQRAIAVDNLSMSKEQLEQNTKNTLAQVRANNISKARIEWIQNLRPLLSDFFANIAKAKMELDEAVVAKDKSNAEEMHKRIKAYSDISHILGSQNNQIQLFLNTKRNSHKELEDSINDYLSTLTLDSDLKREDNDDTLETVIANSRKVIKEAWEQAKTDASI